MADISQSIEQMELSRSDSVETSESLDSNGGPGSMVSTNELEQPLIPADQVGTLVNRRTVYETVPKKLDPAGPKPHSIKLAPLVDHAQTVLSTARAAVRKLPADGIVKVGRLERSDEKHRPIVYASKVVSRNHAELVLKGGSWYVRDVGSSSGTFLNNDRLSAPATESELRRVTTGDVIRFGVDFRGGQEPQYKAIRVRVELDGGADRQPQEYQKQQFAKLKEIVGADQNANSETCALCLEDISLFNSLFVSPCCHMWHYKCIRSTVVNNYPYFECPLCRKTFDLEEASDDDSDESEQ